MALTTSDDVQRDKFQDLELKLLEQEHRLYQSIINFYQYRHERGSYRLAALKSLVLCLIGLGMRGGAVVGVGVVGIATLLVAIQANQLLNEQNRRLDVQSHLLEAQRRSAASYQIQDVLQAAEREAQRSGNSGGTFVASASLRRRIAGLSRTLTPYYYLALQSGGRWRDGNYSGDSAALASSSLALNPRPLSPERAQLLLGLIAVGVDISGANVPGVTFADADFSNASIDGADLSGVDLMRSSFRYASFSGSQIGRIVTEEEDEASMKAGKGSIWALYRSSVGGADFTCATFYDTSLFATAHGAKFAHVEFDAFDFIDASAENYIDSAMLDYADLTDASFDGVVLQKSNLLFFSEGYGEPPKGFRRAEWKLEQDPNDAELMVVRRRAEPSPSPVDGGTPACG